MKRIILLFQIIMLSLCMYSCGGVISSSQTEQTLPNITVNIISSKSFISTNCSSPLRAILTGTYTDVTYTWYAQNGTISGIGENVIYTAGATGSSTSCNSFPITLNLTDSIGRTGSVIFSMFIKIPGDVDGNGIVNDMDKMLVNNSFGLNGDDGWIAADIDCNGVVNILDKVLVRNNYGQQGCNISDVCIGDFDLDGDVDDDDLAVFSVDDGRTDCTNGSDPDCECDLDIDGDCDADDTAIFNDYYGRTDCGIL